MREKAINAIKILLTVKGIQRLFFDIKGVIKKAIKLNITKLNAVWPLGNENEAETKLKSCGRKEWENFLKNKTAPVVSTKAINKCTADRHCFLSNKKSVASILINVIVLGSPISAMTTNILFHVSVRMLCNK